MEAVVEGGGPIIGYCLPTLTGVDGWKLTWSPHGEGQSSHIGVVKEKSFSFRSLYIYLAAYPQLRQCGSAIIPPHDMQHVTPG